MNDEIHRRYHEVADIFPLMQGADFDTLKADIAEHGLREPIWLHPDQSIVDGRNRHRACVELGIVPGFETWSGHGSLVAFVVSLNLHRRHLTPSQKAACSPDIEREIAKEIAADKAEKNRVLALRREEEKRQGRATKVGKTPLLPDAPDTPTLDQVPVLIPEPGREAREETALVLGIGGKYVSDAKALERDAPDLLEQVKRGDLSITQAKRQLIKRRAPEAPVLPDGKYRIIYADPPWSYGNTMPEGTTQPDDHYAAMTTPDIAALPIKDMAQDDAVLFIWTTSPHLPETFEVIKSWGFRYKASFVWDKVKHNMGHYNSVRHEFLLLCVRGSCQPDVPKLFDSVVSVERTEHSVKPEIFREIIDTIYPHGQRIELFARHKVVGWDTWGNEIGEQSPEQVQR